MNQKKIGKFIAELRIEQSMTQKDLAQRLGVSDKTISKWETGRGLPEISIMMALCDTLGVSINELLSGERLNMSTYREKAEENIVSLMKKRSYKKVICHIAISALLFVIAFLMIPLAAEKIISPINILIAYFWSILLIVGNFVAGLVYGAMKKWGKARLIGISIYNVVLLVIQINVFSMVSIVFSVA